jgi:hypothetical protein
MDDGLRRRIEQILGANRIMSLATLRPDGWPQVTTVGYANEGLSLYFLCGPESQKAINLAGDPRASLAINGDSAQVMGITGLSMAAHAEPIGDAGEVVRILGLLAARYPTQEGLPGAMPPPEQIRIFRLHPRVISVIDYSKGFGHTDLVKL